MPSFPSACVLGATICPRISRANRASARCSRSSHSQTTSTFQPACRSAFCWRRSRSRFILSFSFHHSRFDAGNVENRHPPWRCQKQPCTNTTVLNLGKTRSGVPGRSRRCRRNLRPARCMARRTTSSGRVFFAPMRAIMRLRTAGLTVSTTQNSVAMEAAICFASFGGTALPTC